MRTNRVPLLAAIFLYSYEAEFMQKLIIKDNKNTESKAFNLTFRGRRGRDVW